MKNFRFSKNGTLPRPTLVPPQDRGFAVPPILLFAFIFTVIFLLHSPLLRLPYFWDEAGYFVPAARDLMLTGDPIPTSTLSNAHPPLVMAWLALWWKLSGFTPVVTRTAMLLVSAFTLLGVFRLARQVANSQVAVASTILTALFPVFFAQSSMAHLDMAAAAFTLWGLAAYLRENRWHAVFFFALAGIAKETAIVAPLAIFGWEIICPLVQKKWSGLCLHGTNRVSRSLGLLVSVLPLAAWLAYHYQRTGIIFGNPEFFRYNVQATIHPLRILLAVIQRLWQGFGYLNLFVLTGSAGLAMLYSPVIREGKERPRIAVPVQAIFAVLLAAYILMLAILGGAVLARYMLPVVPLVIIISVSTLRRRVAWWRWIVAVAALGFATALFVVPPYRISPEDNLSYTDYIRLHKVADEVIAAKYAGKTVLTAWPASDELTKPYLGYVKNPVKVLRIENFSLPQISDAAQISGQYDVVLLFSTKLDPSHQLFGRMRFWQRIQERFFDYHRDLPPLVAAQLLGGRLVYEKSAGGEWVAIVELEHDVYAKRF